MYNELLNRIEQDRLRSYVAGKKVLLVGNAATLFSDPHHGELIDSYDVVLRFGKGVPYTKYREYLGIKKDIWFFGTARAGVWKHFLNARFRVMTMSQINMYKENESSLLINKCMFDGSLQLYRDFMLAGDLNYTKQVAEDVNGDTSSGKIRLSQGVQAVHFFDRVIQSQESINLIGFDFFEHEFKYAYDAAAGLNVPKEHVIGSWHCPLTAPSFEQNPHLLSKEKEFFAGIKGLNIHPAPAAIDVERMSTILKELRGDKATFIGPTS